MTSDTPRQDAEAQTLRGVPLNCLYSALARQDPATLNVLEWKGEKLFRLRGNELL